MQLILTRRDAYHTDEWIRQKHTQAADPPLVESMGEHE